MRLDKYLKTARILKRRTVSNQLAKHQRVLINDKIAKPSSEVKINDMIAVYYGQRMLKVRVLAVETAARKADAALMYEVMEEKIIEEKIVE